MPKILAAVDLSDDSRSAFEAATKLAQDLKAEMVLVHAFEPIKPWEGIAGGHRHHDIARQVIQDEREAARELTTEWAEKARAAGVQVEVVAEEADADAFIIDQAKKHDAALIVMGSHGRRGLKRILMGSIAESVLRHADRPVVVVPAKRN